MTRHILVLGLALAVGACSSTYPTYPVVPPPLPERVPTPPRSPVALIWQPGHYDWTGQTYAWIPGRWVERAGHGELWQDGFWRRSGSTYVWEPAHWI